MGFGFNVCFRVSGFRSCFDHAFLELAATPGGTVTGGPGKNHKQQHEEAECNKNYDCEGCQPPGIVEDTRTARRAA